VCSANLQLDILMGSKEVESYKVVEIYRIYDPRCHARIGQGLADYSNAGLSPVRRYSNLLIT
jgi:hypothetical protein